MFNETVSFFNHVFSQLMSSGSSRPWPEVLRELTGGESALLDPKALLEYFTPLEQWLRVQNGREGLEPWKLDDPGRIDPR